jgi:methionyl-tRNA synthetase
MQLFCEDCQRFLADRYIVGTCPTCSSTGARGDQCDICARLLTPQDLLHPRCKVCGATNITEKTSPHLFLNLPELSVCARVVLVERFVAAVSWWC